MLMSFRAVLPSQEWDVEHGNGSRRGFLEAVKAKSGKISAWVRSQQWPPPVEFFESGPIGFAFYVQTWFRYYLQQWIEKRQSELETKEGVYSYGLRGGVTPNRYMRAGNIDGTFLREGSEEVAQPHGRHTPAPILTDNELANGRSTSENSTSNGSIIRKIPFSGISAGMSTSAAAGGPFEEVKIVAYRHGESQ